MDNERIRFIFKVNTCSSFFRLNKKTSKGIEIKDKISGILGETKRLYQNIKIKDNKKVAGSPS